MILNLLGGVFHLSFQSHSLNKKTQQTNILHMFHTMATYWKLNETDCLMSKQIILSNHDNIC
jgi:hypothetical protein